MIEYVRPAGDLKYTVANLCERIWTCTFNIKSSVVNELEANILNCGLLPVFGYSPFPQDLYALCSKIDLQQNKEQPKLWTASCEWKTLLGKDPQNEQKQPDQRRPVWSYSFQPISKYLPADLDGKQFKDAAGTPFDPPPERPIYVDEITIERYESSLDRGNDRKYLGATNTDSWQDASPGEALMHNIAAVETFEFGRYWFKRTFTLLVSPRITIAGTMDQGGNPFIGAWDYECILNQGPCFIAQPPSVDAGKPVPISKAGYIDGRPALLDLNGKVLGPTVPAAQTTFLRFRTKNKTAFGALNLVPPY
jgi:hypothetical protein